MGMAFNVESAARGRPPRYETPQDLAEKMGEYFDTGCKRKRPNRDGIAEDVCIPTFEGLAHYLGFASRDGLYKQSGRSGEFLYTIKCAQGYIAMQYEENLQMGDATTGSIFALKCMAGWVEEEKKADPDSKEKPKFSISNLMGKK